MIEHRQLRAQLGRHLQPGLRHQGKQAHGFQGDGFAAGVGAGDDEGGKVLPQPQIAGHHLFRVDEGMPSPDDLQPSLPVDLRQHGPHLAAQQALGKGKVQFPQQRQIALQRLAVGGQRIGQGLQDAGDLLLLPGIELL